MITIIDEKDCPLCQKGTIKFRQNDDYYSLVCTFCGAFGGCFNSKDSLDRQYELFTSLAQFKNKTKK